MIDIAISNIAWNNNNFEEALSILKQEKIKKIELSLNKIFKEPILEPENSFIDLKNLLQKYDLEVVATHSLFYTKKKYNLFDRKGYKILNNYLLGIEKIMKIFNSNKIIFGSGSCRNIFDAKNDNVKVFINFIQDFFEKSENKNSQILIEPLSKVETNFINNCNEAMSIIKAINTDRLNLHIDLKSSMNEKEDFDFIFKNYFNYIKHIHISDNNLEAPSEKSGYHESFSDILKKYNYKGCVSIEMKEINPWSKKELSSTLNFVKEMYLT